MTPVSDQAFSENSPDLLKNILIKNVKKLDKRPESDKKKSESGRKTGSSDIWTAYREEDEMLHHGNYAPVKLFWNLQQLHIWN